MQTYQFNSFTVNKVIYSVDRNEINSHIGSLLDQTTGNKSEVQRIKSDN